MKFLRLIAALAAVLFGAALLASCHGGPHDHAECPAGYVYHSTQWWGVRFENGPLSRQIPQADGTMGHIHVEFCAPGTVQTGSTVNVPVHVMMHKVAGGLSGNRLDVGLGPSGTSIGSAPLNMSCAPEPATCHKDVTVPVDLDAVRQIEGSGRRELRFRFLPAEHGNGKRVFATNGVQVCVDSCSPTYRESSLTVIGRGWTEEVEYSIAEFHEGQLTSPITISGGATRNIRYGVDGTHPPTMHFVHLDALFGTDNFGTVLKLAGAGDFEGTVAVNTSQLANGYHCLAIRTDTHHVNGVNVGIVQMPLIVTNNPNGTKTGAGGCGGGTPGVPPVS